MNRSNGGIKMIDENYDDVGFMDFIAENPEDDLELSSEVDDKLYSLEADDVFECPYCHEKVESMDIIWIEPDDGVVECPVCSAQFNCGTTQY